jgi:hypothetical protein
VGFCGVVRDDPVEAVAAEVQSAGLPSDTYSSTGVELRLGTRTRWLPVITTRYGLSRSAPSAVEVLVGDHVERDADLVEPVDDAESAGELPHAVELPPRAGSAGPS